MWKVFGEEGVMVQFGPLWKERMIELSKRRKDRDRRQPEPSRLAGWGGGHGAEQDVAEHVLPAHGHQGDDRLPASAQGIDELVFYDIGASPEALIERAYGEHRADYDAHYQALILQALLDRKP